jgi:transposase
LFREIKAQGYQDKEGILRLYVCQFKPQSKDEPVVQFETPPGEQMQVDFTTITRGSHKLKAFVATLGYSRATFVRFSDNEQQEAWLTGIREALLYIGGVPRQLLFDSKRSFNHVLLSITERVEDGVHL